MPTVSKDERKLEYVQVLGAEAGECLMLLEDQFFSVLCDWLVYKGLFGTSKARIHTLNKASGLVSWVIERTMWDSVVLRLAHMGDPAGNRGIESLSLDKLNQALRTEGWSVESKTYYRMLRKEAKNLLGKLEPIRNKVLAHTDYKMAASQYQGVSRASRKHIDDTIAAVDRILNLVRSASGLMILDNQFLEQHIIESTAVFLSALSHGVDTQD